MFFNVFILIGIVLYIVNIILILGPIDILLTISSVCWAAAIGVIIIRDIYKLTNFSYEEK